MDSRDSQLANPLNKRVSSVVCIDGSEFGLDGSGGLQLFLIVAIEIQDSREPYGCMSINKTGGCYRSLEEAVSLGNFHLTERANLFDLPGF